MGYLLSFTNKWKLFVSLLSFSKKEGKIRKKAMIAGVKNNHVLSRKSIFAREMAGTKEDIQIVATNIDTVFICMSLNDDYNLRRLERYLSIAWDSGAVPVIVLTKSDLCKDIEIRLNEVSSIAFGVEVLVTTSTSDEGYQSLKRFLSSGKTAAFIGSSGVGKSTLINCLQGQNISETNEIRNDDKGRHT